MLLFIGTHSVTTTLNVHSRSRSFVGAIDLRGLAPSVRLFRNINCRGNAGWSPKGGPHGKSFTTRYPLSGRYFLPVHVGVRAVLSRNPCFSEFLIVHNGARCARARQRQMCRETTMYSCLPNHDKCTSLCEHVLQRACTEN